MASSPVTGPAPVPGGPRPNLAFRELRGPRSPGEFAAAVRRAAREIGERVSCDARYVGRVEAGEIRCPNYAYERVFRHMFPGRTLADLGFAARSAVRGRSPSAERAKPSGTAGLPGPRSPGAPPERHGGPYGTHRGAEVDSGTEIQSSTRSDEESDVQRRAFMTGGTAAFAAALGPFGPGADSAVAVRRAGESEVRALEEAVRGIRLLDDRHGADGLYRRAGAPLRAAYALLDAGASRGSTAGRLHAGAGELALSVGWLAHDSGRHEDARSHYAEALATARIAGDAALEAHAFSNTAFLARDAHRPREAVRAAQAGLRAARELGSARLLSLLTLREAGGWAGLADRASCVRALAAARSLFAAGPAEADPEWMSFFGAAEFEGLQAQCWSALGDWRTAAAHARRAVGLQDPHFTRNTALYTAELAQDLARAGRPDEAAAEGGRVLDLLGVVQSTRIQSMLASAARVLLPQRKAAGVGDFLAQHTAFLERQTALPRRA
ncbi:tetratricopeptide repeat protein [Streptomyces physcomitrii]|uniref:tetratricopeptide repeat protein n=1 Tax=Streptomyces physcomitrii TaxID=2724184 RepID=UPI00340D7547